MSKRYTVTLTQIIFQVVFFVCACLTRWVVFWLPSHFQRHAIVMSWANLAVLAGHVTCCLLCGGGCDPYLPLIVTHSAYNNFFINHKPTKMHYLSHNPEGQSVVVFLFFCFFVCRSLNDIKDREICCYSISCKERENIGEYFVRRERRSRSFGQQLQHDKSLSYMLALCMCRIWNCMPECIIMCALELAVVTKLYNHVLLNWGCSWLRWSQSFSALTLLVQAYYVSVLALIIIYKYYQTLSLGWLHYFCCFISSDITLQWLIQTSKNKKST